MTFAQFARYKRIEANLSQDTVSQALGFSHRAQIHKLETGKLEWKLESVIRFAELLGMRTSELLREYEK